MLRLMIVDDEQIIREALSSMIDYTSLGYKVIATAKNGMEAYDRIRDDYPDVVITDIKMPILNGLELIERASHIDSRITFILLSGYGEFEYAKQAMKYGVRYYLLKPTDKQELISCLNTIREEKKQKEIQQKAEQELLLKDMQSPLEQGLRLDVAYCLDHDFLRRLRSFCDSLKPDFFLVGETLHGDYNQWMNDSMLHSVTNYECYKGLYSSFNSMNMFEINHSLLRQFGPDNWTLYKGKHLLCFVDNHDAINKFI